MPDVAEAPALDQAAQIAATRSDAPHVTLAHVLAPKWLTLRARASDERRGRTARWTLLGGIGVLFWAFIFGMLYKLLVYFRGVEEIGPLLAGKLLGLMLMGFFSLLLLSSVITALSTYFLAKDLDTLVGAPVDWLTIYTAKLLETIVNASWMVALMAVPMLAAYGIVYHGGALFVFVAIAVMVPFFAIPGIVGSALTLILVNVFPARRTRDILSVIAVFTAGALVLLFRIARPERFAKPEGFRSLVDFVATLRTPSSAWYPSEWAARAIMAWLTEHGDILPFYLLWSTTGAFVVLGALLHRRLYRTGFSKAQEGAGLNTGSQRAEGPFSRPLKVFGVLRRELLLKELRLFFRDTTQWSQLILLAVLVVVYVFNIKYLPLKGEGITFFLVNVVPFLNLVLAGFVLASIAARFIFPGVSLEGRTLWLLRSSPLEMRDLLWAKFWVGTAPLLILALGIVFTTDALLQVSGFMMAVSVLTITLMTFALAGLAICFGTLYPQFETENAAQIPTSFGGLLYMMASVVLIAAVIILEARPVYEYLSAKAFGTQADVTSMVAGFALAAGVCVAATILPVELAKRRLEMLER